MYHVHNDKSPDLAHFYSISPLRSVCNWCAGFRSIGLIIIFLAVHFPGVAFPSQLDLPRDANGWTIFTPSADTDVVYVDSVTGNDTICRSYRTTDAEMGVDPFNPAGAILPCATTYKAQTLIPGQGQPDWILHKRGSVFNAGITNSKNGRSATEPMVIASYGGSGAMPIFRSGYENNGNLSTQYVAISGLDFYRDTRDPSSPNYAPTGQATTGMFFFAHAAYNIKSLLIEGCRVRFFLNNLNIAPVATTGNTGITFRRNAILNAYSRIEGHSQGMLMNNFDGAILEENIFDHNGWLVQNDGDGISEEGEATMFNHNIYLTNNKNMSLKNNIFIRGSSNNTKIKYTATGVGTGLVIDNNLYLGGEIAMSIGAPDERAIYSTVSPQVTNNVWLNPGKWNPTNRALAWFFYNFNWDGGNVSKNLMLNQDDDGIGGKFFHIAYSGRNVTVENNIVYNAKKIAAIELGALDSNNFNPPRDGFVISNNIFDVSSAYIVDATALADVAAYTFSGNKYNSTKTVDTWFRVGSKTLSNAQWQTATGDKSAFEQASFFDTTRSIETYMASIGENASIELFIGKCRAQDRFSWNQHYTAETVNASVHAGFKRSGVLSNPAGFRQDK